MDSVQSLSRERKGQDWGKRWPGLGQIRDTDPQEASKVRNMGFQKVWAWVPLSSVASGESLSFSEPHFPYVGNR